MKKMTKWALMLALLFPAFLQAQNIVNITPVPKSMTVSEGSLDLSRDFQINIVDLDDSCKSEAVRFAETFSATTGFKVTVVSGTADALFQVQMNTGAAKMNPEGYKLQVTADKVTIEAETARGFFYAFQTVKKMLPANVMAGVQDEKVKTYTLPLVDIDDEPRFGYRGYMLDVCRHFFTVDEVKRMLDVMAYYKLNVFHFHLTEDQGWRVEIKKYPKLTSVGAVRDFSWNTDYPGTGKRYRTYEPYGPYFYTQEEIKEIVAYAAERHIDVLPEVDMPGHFSAAMAAYPEYSCTPEGAHPIPCDGGIYSDVLNVANPGAVEFAKDIMDELMELFPYPYFHIGGDECPTTAWENNEECKALVKELGYDSFRKLQSRFIKQMAEHAAKKGRTIYVWNEAISANGADVNVIKDAGAKVMCWVGAEAAAQQAANLGLDNVLTPQPIYYINRKQSTDPGEPNAAGSGSDNLQAVYNYAPANGVNADKMKYYTGVQGTFWTEHVSTAQYVEYLSLPRLMAVAESGWSPQEKKNFNNFCERMKMDTVLLNYNNYDYGRHYLRTASETDMVMPVSSSAENPFWYRLVTLASDSYRSGKCIELLREGAPQIGTGNAQVNRLWNGTIAEEGDPAYDYQLWALFEDPENPGKYALVNKAKPNGSVNPVATAQANTGRWDYDDSKYNYNFELNNKNFYGIVGTNHYYSIRSDRSNAGLYMNMGAGGQNYAINQYTDPKDGNGGLWEFRPLTPPAIDLSKLIDEAERLLAFAKTYDQEENKRIGLFSKTSADALKTAIEAEDATEESITAALDAMKASLVTPTDGQQIRITNTVDNYAGNMLTDNGTTKLQHTSSPWGAQIWVVSQAKNNGTGFNFALKNLATEKFINGTANPLSLGTEAVIYNGTFNLEEGDFTLKTAEDKAWFPVSEAFKTNPGCVYVDGIRAQGAAWQIEEAVQIKYICKDEAGKELGTYLHSAAKGSDYTAIAPEIKNCIIVGFGENGTETSLEIPAISENQEIIAVYKRLACTLTYICKDSKGNPLETKSVDCELNQDVTITYPEIKYFSFASSDWKGEETFKPTKDETIQVVYTTDGLTGYKAVGSKVTKIEDGRQYLFFNTANDANRNGYLNLSKTNQIITSNVDKGTPAFVWNVTADEENTFRISNEYNELLIPSLPNGANVTASTNGDRFEFTLNADGSTWTIKGSNGQYWNGNAGAFTGWTDAHPYTIYEVVNVPYFEINIEYTDTLGNALSNLQPIKQILIAGSAYELNIPEVEGFTYLKTEGDAEQLKDLSKNVSIKVIYKEDEKTGINQVEDETGNDTLYDLEGRKLNDAKTRKGIYIRNGEKIIKQ